MKTRLLAILSSAALMYVACLDVTPSVIVRKNGAKPREAQCLQCLEAPAVPGPGCGELIAGCRAETACKLELECSYSIGHCYGGTRDDLGACAQQCLKNGYFTSGMDPALAASSLFYDCIVRGPCSDICFGTGSEADAGTPEGGDAGDASALACVNASDAERMKSQALADAPKTCGTKCFGVSDAKCAETCVAATTGLSPGCSTCWGEQIKCGIRECLSPCLGGGQACSDCTAQKCNPAFKACSGVELP